jgi:hypothetical protein
MSRHSGFLSQFPGDFGHIHYYLNMRRSRNEQAFWFVVAVSWRFRPYTLLFEYAKEQK